MRLIPIALFGALALAPAALAQAPDSLHVAYATYAAGLQVAAVKADLMLGPHQYQIRVSYHTTGLLGFFSHGQQSNRVDGIWHAGIPEPREFSSAGVWKGEKHVTRIDYRNGDPLVQALLPPNTGRQPVPPGLQDHTIDALSALALLIQQVATTRTCQAAVHTYDGRRAAELTAHSVGWEMLPPTGRSAFSGPALRCDFTSRVLAGFKTGSDQKDQPPLHGSLWFAAPVPGEPSLPVRIRLETAWFGDAVAYLTAAERERPPVVAQQH